VNQVNRLHKKYSQSGSGIPFSAMRKKSRKKQKKKGPNKSRRLRKIKKKMTRRKRQTKRKTRTNTCQCGSNTYTGKEDSPRGLGKCEECIPLNVMIKGKDGTLYENKKEGWVKA
jgi:hypothetical protein